MVDAYLETVWRLYTRYPYADGARGHVYVIDPEDDDRNDWGRPRRGEGARGHRFTGNLAVHGAYLGPTLGRAGVDFELMVRRFGFAVDAQPHFETRPADALTLGSAAFMVAPILRRRFQIYAGLGVAAMIDGRPRGSEGRTDAIGANGTFRATVLPISPMVLRGRFDIGQLGTASTRYGRGTVGVMLRRTELFAGYEVRDVGKVRTHGPMTGIRIWF